MPSSPSSESLPLVVDVAFKVATMHGSRVSLSELEQLLPSGLSYEDLVGALQTHPKLATKYVLKEGYLLSRDESGQGPSPDNLLMQRSNANFGVAKWLTHAVAVGPDTLIAVSGSTSYRSPAKTDDVDLFCVTPQDSMWVFLAKSLIFTRLSRLISRSRPPICLSCVMDIGYARDMFSKDMGALFARDALVTEVINGDGIYGGLLAQGRWMMKYFPRLYSLRADSAVASRFPRTKTAWWTRLVNRVVFITLGNYILAKARLHNRYVRRSGKTSASFTARIGPDRLIYESSRYIELQKIYSDLKPNSGATAESKPGMEQVDQGPRPGPQ